MTGDPVAPVTGPGLETAWAHALADELLALTTLLDTLADDLTADPATIRRHMHSLQAVDRIAQTQRAIAQLLRAGTAADEALEAVPLEDMARRLKARLHHQRAHADSSRARDEA